MVYKLGMVVQSQRQLEQHVGEVYSVLLARMRSGTIPTRSAVDDAGPMVQRVESPFAPSS